MEYVILFGALLIFYVFVVIQGTLNERKIRKHFIARLKKEYNKLNNAEFSNERMQSISGMYEWHQGEQFTIDDITWNDIDGDRLYRSINHCYSSAGDEYLYYRMRTPILSENKDEFQKNEAVYAYMREHEEERIAFQLLFAKMGRTGKFSLYRYLQYLCELPGKKAIVFVIPWIILVLGIVLLFVNTYIGLGILVCILSYMILSYMKKKKDIEPYLVSFEYILRMLITAEKVAKSVPEVWKEEGMELKELRKTLRDISGLNQWFVGSDYSSNAATDIVSSLLMLVKMLTHVDLFIFYRMLGTVSNHTAEIDRINTILGKMETDITVSAFRNALPVYAVPEFDGKGMDIQEAVHPLIKEPVSNSFSLEKGMLLTGSNASGKSTFLKTVAICALLAQTIQTVPAKKYAAECYRIFSSMSLRDDLEAKESYYMAEIRSIKRILEAVSESGAKVLCFVDEVLRGTNTVERIAAASEIMRSFSGENMLCFAATHDIELTQLLADVYDNYHFEEQIENNDILFPYKLLKGPANTRNAIKLLSLMGYPDDLIANAEWMAGCFLQEGEWRNKESKQK
ncbi:MAG: hypothetical protein IJ397_07995 [Lachnospiraceae bacterium]|nr:hypothetical protein [Lachnospiraceae bacterium]